MSEFVGSKFQLFVAAALRAVYFVTATLSQGKSNGIIDFLKTK